MSDGKRVFPATRLVLLAAVAGIVAGTVAVYVSGTMSGNNSAEIVAAPGNDRTCAARTAKAEALGAAATGGVAAMAAANPPQSLDGLAFNGPDGRALTIGDKAGKTVLVNLWATWCAPCRAEMPALDSLQKEMGSDRFEVVAVNVDKGDAEKMQSFLSETGVTALAQYRDPTMGIFNDLKKRGLALGLPVTLLIDDEGCLLANMNGPAEWAGQDAKKLVATALGD